MERHVLPDDPANNNQERGDEKSDLDTGANGNTHGEIHLVADSHDNGSDVLGRITNNRNEDQTDESFTDTRVHNQIVDASHEIFGADRHENRSYHQHAGGGDRTNRRLLHLTLFLGLGSGLTLGVEEVAMGLKLENEVQNVKQEKDDGSASGQDQDTPVLLVTVARILIENSVELRNLSAMPPLKK